jgi:acetyl esterase/lipase
MKRKPKKVLVVGDEAGADMAVQSASSIQLARLGYTAELIRF